MAAETLKVLLIEDNPGDARLIREMLAAASFDRFVLEDTDCVSDGLARLSQDSFAVILLDLSLGETQGINTFRAVHDQAPSIPVVVLTGSNDDVLAKEALQAGAQDYLVKGEVDRNLLARSLRYAVERGRIEEQLRQRATELAEEGRRKDEFLAILSHELRNPLSPLMVAVELLRNPQARDDERQWAHSMIERQVGTLTRLVDDLLDISRINRGKITLRKEAVDLSVIINCAVEATRPLFKEHNHRLSLSLPPQPIRVNGDTVRLEQVVVNLLTNAARYTDRGGNVRVSAAAEDNDAVIRVQDTGVGIPSEMLERVFELFTRVDSSTDRRSQWGMGVGLALVRSFVELHGGTIKATSAGQGSGSEFLVRLPLLRDEHRTDGTPSDGQPRETDSTDDRPRKVLIAEDHADSAQSMARLLRMWRHEVRVVDNGPAALAAAREFRPDVVLLDIGLPEMDGYEVARKLREEATFDNLQLFALTGYGQEEDRRRAAEAGFNSHVTKPIDLEVLRKLLADRSPKASTGAGTT